MPYFEPRVMRHKDQSGTEEYAIHEVYFTDDGQMNAYTEAALSSREATVADLKEAISKAAHLDEAQLGDLGYTYTQGNILWWLENIDLPPLDYENDPE